ncbi:MAG: amino acid ABC transporter ATP-binding protein [Oscillospiraceae bacterium]|jgi:polar amino acid transport system ATP-binding protein|nr:amino acid ABC transporter ATP-binding protein [Oscillospiraceae bacterium]
MNETAPLLRLTNIKKRFGSNVVLRGIDLEVQAHEVVTLIGASGSGKSTLLRIINLLETLDDGQIFLNGEDISNPRIPPDSVRTKIGIVFQNYNLFPHMTVLDNVTLSSRKVHKISKQEAETTGLALLERIGIAAKARVYPDQLSGGQQQRVAIVRAIASNPELLLLDEITSALDPQLVGEVLDLVRELKTTQTTIVMATHEMEFARNVSDKVVYLKSGIVEEIGPPEQIFDNPLKQSTREFLR